MPSNKAPLTLGLPSFLHSRSGFHEFEGDPRSERCPQRTYEIYSRRAFCFYTWLTTIPSFFCEAEVCARSAGLLLRSKHSFKQKPCNLQPGFLYDLTQDVAWNLSQPDTNIYRILHVFYVLPSSLIDPLKTCTAPARWKGSHML